MLLEPLSSVKQSAQVALKLAELMRSVTQHSPAEHGRAVVFLQVREIASRSHVAATHPHATFYLDSDS